MTYSQMISKSQAIAATLKVKGCTRGSVIAVYQEPSHGWLSSVIDVFSIGAICVPFDAGTPTKRLRDMARGSRVGVIIVDAELEAMAASELLVDGAAEAIISVDRCVDVDSEARAVISAARPEPEDPAMILYTSRSTSDPEGIVVKHGGLRNWAEFVPGRLSHSPGRVGTVLQQSSSSFDMALLQVFWALCFGGTVTNGVPSEYSNWLRYGNMEVARALWLALENSRQCAVVSEPGTPSITYGPLRLLGQTWTLTAVLPHVRPDRDHLHHPRHGVDLYEPWFQAREDDFCGRAAPQLLHLHPRRAASACPAQRPGRGLHRRVAAALDSPAYERPEAYRR